MNHDLLLVTKHTEDLKSLKGRTIHSIGANYLYVNQNSILGDTFCLFLQNRKGGFSGWDKINDFFTFRVADLDFEDCHPVYAALDVQQGITSSEIPFDIEHKAPGPCSSIDDLVRDFEIRNLETLICRTTIAGSQSNDRSSGDRLQLTIEAGVVFTSTENRKFVIYTEQSADLTFGFENLLNDLLNHKSSVPWAPKYSIGKML